MAEKSKKEKQQVIALGVLMCIILGVIAYMNRDAFIPAPVTSPNILTGAPIEDVATVDYSKVFTRKDFTNLKDYAGLPIGPGTLGSDDPFGEYVE